MAERIKKDLLNCTMQPRCTPYVCMNARVLTEKMAEIRRLNDQDFLEVHNYAQTLDLPPDFLDKLKEQYYRRLL